MSFGAGGNGVPELHFRALPFLDKKWIKADVSAALRSPEDLANLWNHLVQDEEVVTARLQTSVNAAGDVAYARPDGKYYCGVQSLSCSCCKGVCSVNSSCSCSACQILEAEEGPAKKTPSGQSSQQNQNQCETPGGCSGTILDSWLWSPIPTFDEKRTCTRKLIAEQREICLQAAANCLSATRTKQLLYVYRRYFVALQRCKPDEKVSTGTGEEKALSEQQQQQMVGSEVGDPAKLSKNSSFDRSGTASAPVSTAPLKDCDKATFGLARVGTRAALNFSFAFLRRAWRSGEDVELCSELLSEALEALQTLPEASLFDTSQMSSLWTEVVEKSIKFLRQVVLGDVMGGRCLVPKADRHIALNLLLELGAQKGTLGGSLEGISLLLTLHEKDQEVDDNRSVPQSSGAPLVPLLKRYEGIDSLGSGYGGGTDSFHFGPTESFLRFLTLPETEAANVDLKQAAVIIISHLDRLAKPHLPAGNYSAKVNKSNASQKIFTLGWSSCSPEMYGFTSEASNASAQLLAGSVPRYSTATIELPAPLQVKQVACTENSIYIVTTNGQVFSIHSNCAETVAPKPVEGLENVNVIQIAAHCEGRHAMALSSAGEVYSWGAGEGGRLGHGDTASKEVPTKIAAMDRPVSSIYAGASYSAAVTSTGELFTWGRGTYGRLGHGNSDDKFVPTQVQALKAYKVVDVALGSGDAHSMAVTDGGLLFAWGDGDFGKLGNGSCNGSCNGSPLPVQIESVANVARIYSGSQFSVALSYDGTLYSWGKGHGGRLGHGNSEHSNVPKLVHALEGKKIVDVAVGSAHCLALTSSGELYGWGRNDYQQICPSGVSRDPIIQTPILTTPPTLRISGMTCGAAQSIVWCHSSTLGVASKIPFVVDLSEHTFRQLDQLLCMVCPGTGPGDIRHPPSQEAECIAVASLNLLRLQLHAMIVNNVPARAVGLVEGSRLLASLKSRILTLAGGPVVLKTMQEAAQWTLQVGWSILLPTASERAQTLTSLLPVGHDASNATSNSSSGHRFMTDLLVGSLMAEGGLQTALNQAINAQRSQDCGSGSGSTHLSLLHLLKQLLRNNSSLTQARLGQLMLGPYLKTEEAFSSPEPPSPSLDLLHKFQRLLLSYIYQSKTDLDLSGAEALLDTYIQQVVGACVTTLNKAHETILQGKEGVPEILESDISDALLYELLIGLVLIQKEKSLFLSSFDWNKHFIPLLHALDNFNRLTHEGEVHDSDDMGWPGIICRGSAKSPPVQEETLLIRKSDIENHCADGGNWVIINGNVYDVADYQPDSPATQEILQPGRDISLEIANPQHRTAFEFITSFLRVGRYAINEICDKESPRTLTTLTHFHSETTLAYLLGLRSSILQSGSPLQPAEINCKNLLNSTILSGGLQVLQPSNPFDEEKGEARSSGSTAGSTPTDASSQIPIADVPQMANWPSVLISHRVENMLSQLGEGKLTDPLVASWIVICERFCKENHLIWHQEFPPEHPVMELERLLMAVLIRHQNLGPLALAVVDRELSGNCSKPPPPIVNIIKQVHQTKWSIVKMRQQLNRSYKEVCAPMIDKCRFLLYEIRPAISLEQHGLGNLHILHKLPRFKALVRKIIMEMRIAKKQLACAKPEDILNVTIQSQFTSSVTKIQSQENLACKNQSTENLVNESLIKVASLESLTAGRDRSASPVILAVQKVNTASDENLLSAVNVNVDGGGGGGDGDGGDKKIPITSDEIKTPTNELIDYNNSKMKNPDGGDEFINNVIASLSEKCLIESYPAEFKNGVSQQIVDFILYDLCDVETLRRALYCQIQRYQIRKQGLEMFYELLKIPGLFDAAQYNLFNGYLGMHASKSNQNSEHILENLNMITAFQKADILIAQSKIIEWTVAELQKYVNQEKINGRHRNHGEKDNSNLGTYVFLKKLPRARFLLSIFGILSRTYEANELSLLINSGILGTIMGLLRQTGADLPNTKNNTDISVIYEDVVTNLKSSKEGLPGPELAKLMKIGTRIARGADWKWGEQDGPGGEGRIISEIGEDGWVRVEWDNGSTNSYRMGKEGQYDLRLADSALKALSPDKDSEKEDFIDQHLYNESHPTKLLRNVCIKTLQMLFASVGMHAEKMQQNSLRSVASMFRAILTNRITYYNFALEQWTTLGFLRAISSSKALSMHLTSPVWIDLAFEILNSPITCKKDVYKKLHCLRLLQSTLVNWTGEEAHRIDDIIVKLFDVLGKISLYCPNDLSLLNNAVDIKSRVLYSASHTGTIAEEIIVLIRKLHTLPLWNENINSFIAQKLCLVADVFLVNELEINFEGEKASIMGALCTIGGCDSRPRLGLNLTLDGVRGTISRMTKKGKVVMNVHSQAETKKIPIFKVSECADVGAFSLSKLSINEMLLNSWAVLFYGIGQTPMNVANSINMGLLQTQQINFSALKATKVLFRHQSLLRKILRQRSPGITRSSSKDSLSDRDGSPEEGKPRSESNTSDESQAYTELLIQTILLRATQPSPLKACYSFQEMELAALNISQMLASHVHNELNAPSNKRAFPVSQATMIHGVPIYNNESALEDAQTPSGAEGVVSASTGRGTARRSPPSPLVAQIMEMGFTRKSVETAIKSLTLHTNIKPTAEQVVQWILEHPDVTANLGGKGDDNDAHSDTESVSSDTMDGGSSLHDSQQVVYKSRDDFKSADQYAIYVRGLICPGMLVRCCQDFEEIRKGDIGTVLKVEPEGLHDLNVRVDWQMRDRPYWMCFVHLELLEAPPSENSATIGVGSQVRIRNTQHFRYRLNTIPRGSIGTVTSVNGTEVTAEFPQQTVWNGHLNELELISNPMNFGSSGQGIYDIIDDWSRCIRSLTVSSNESSAKYLLDRSTNYWQSSSTQGKHWIRLEIHDQVFIQTLSINVDPDDYSHMPSLVVIRGGDSVATLKELHWVSINPTDVVVPLLSDCKQYYTWVEILIKQCRNNGIQCKIHGLNIIGKRKQTDLEMMLQNASFLATENDSAAEPSYSTSSNYADEQSSNEISSKVLVWGLNDKEQLGGLKGSKVKLPTYSSVLSQLKPIHISGGSKSLFIVSQDGKLYACGEGTNGRLGLGHNNNVPTPRQVPILNQYVVKKVAVHSGGKHAMALTLDGKVFSWGEGEDGKLGHGNRVTLEKPKLIESLRTKRIRDIACGSSHSAAITSSGELYTWGLGEYGRLGHGDNCTQLKPKLVTALQGHRVVQVACGSRDAQTLCLTEEGLVFSWGDGDFGKLGRGGSEGCSVPHQVERLNGVGVIQIECGAQFSLALTKIGEVWTWGKGDYYRLGHGTDQHVRKPTPIQGLRGKKVIHVAVGALHCLAVTDSGQVFAWGDNDHGQQGSGNTVVNKKPNLVLGLDGVFVNRVACGSSHSVAWSLPQNPSEKDKKEPVPFAVSKDPLGSHSLGIYALDSEPTTSQPQLGATSAKQQRPSLSESVLSLETYGARQAALSHVLNSMSILHARSCIIAALTCHSQLTIQDKAGFNETRPITPVSDADHDHEPKADAEVAASQQQQHNEVIAHGGGEGPADVSTLIQTNDIADIGDIPIVSGMNNTLSAYRSLTGSLSLSASISSCNATQRHSKMSASAMSVMAATMTHHDEMMHDHPVNSGLDDFTALLGESEAKHLIELLKLSVSGRTGPANTAETIANTLIALAKGSTTISNMLIETCITELEDLCTSRHSLGKPKPVVQETSHPYIDDITLVGHVKIPGAEALRIEFDSQCSTERRNDPLIIIDGAGRVVATRSGREWAQWAPEIRIAGDEMRWKFTSDNSVNGWGWRFFVHAIMPESYLQELGSDRTVLSQPSIAMVMALLDSSLAPTSGTTLTRLTAALSQCAQLSSLTVSQRIWSLKKMHQYLTTKDAPKMPETAMTEILSPLIPIILRQYEYEEPQVRSGLHLMHSEYFKTLVALACDMQLDSMLPHGDAHKWAWFRRYCSAVRVAQSLIRRVALPATFTLEVRKKLIEIASPATNPALPTSGGGPNSLTSSNCSLIQHTSSGSNLSQFELGGATSDIESIDTSKYLHEDHSFFTPQYDSQLLQWFNRRPEDWAFSWGGASTIFGWGHNHRGQLGGLDGSRIKMPTPCEALSLLRPIQIAGGEQTLYAVTPDGKLYATGYGAGGRLGIGGTDSVSTPTLVESLQHVIIKKVAVNSGGKHCLALSSDGEVFSWGEGEDGKLGHGNRDSYDRPKLIEALSGIGVVDIACGSAHSACITSQGHVLTWGKGRYGRLGHGDSEDQLQPKLVEALLGYRAIDIACGSGDAQTLCITDDDNVWSWGDGDYGKLGRGGSDGCKIPMKIESLAGLGVIKVECGSQFSVALTRSGSVYTWGKGDYHRLGHGNTDHVRRPKKVAALQGKKIISIATGSLHCVACSDSGEVFTWGDNDEGQLGDGTVTAIQRPRLVQSLQGKHIVKVICGSAHTLALSTYQLSEAVRPPPSPPLEYDLVRDIAPEVLHARLVLLHHFSELICPGLAMLPITGELSLGALKDILVYSIKEAGFRKVIQTTMVRDKPHGPVIELNRIQVKRSRMRSGNGLAGVDGMKSVFGQMVQKLPLLTQEALSMPHRVWKVKFVGESVDDCGGGFSESIAEMCDELQNGSIPLLIQTPNGRGEAGANRDCFLLDPTLGSVLHMNMFRFLGVLMGIAVRTGSPLSLNLAEPVWRQLCGETLRPSDLTEVDRDYITGLLYIRDIEDDPKVFASMELPFSTPSAKGHEVPLSTRYTKITPENRNEYVKLALNYRIHEFDEQLKAVRDGMSKVIPVPLLSLFSAAELQAMVCGSPDIPLCLLKTVATYKGVESTAPLVQWFWEVMEEFTNQERSLFLRFVWGRTRLPRTIADFRGRDFVLQVLDKYNPPDHFLPESYTCFFLLKMPRYSCKAVLQEKLKYAIYFCKSIDTDEYARVAMGDPTEATGSEDNSDIESIA